MAYLSTYINTGLFPTVEVAVRRLLQNLGAQQLFGNRFDKIIWDNLINFDGLDGVALRNNYLTLPAGKYSYKYNVYVFDGGSDGNRGTVIGLSASNVNFNGQNMVVPFQGPTAYVDSQTVSWITEGRFTVTTPTEISLVYCTAAGVGDDLYLVPGPYYTVDAASRWNQNGLFNTMQTDSGRVTFQQLQAL
jgi:hypothetical protein